MLARPPVSAARLSLCALAVSALLAAAGCANTRTETVEEVEFLGSDVVMETVEVVEEAAPVVRPQREMDRRDRFDSWHPVTGGESIEVDLGERGMAFGDLFALVHEHTDHALFWDPHNAAIKSRRVQGVGSVRIARGDLLAWVQDIAKQSGLVVRPLGPQSRRQWTVMDQAHPGLVSNAVFVAEDDLYKYRGREGVYVNSALTVPEGVDPARARMALSQLSTKTAGLGRINDLPGANVLTVGDFADIVAQMRRLLDEMAVARWQSSQE